MVGVSFVYVYVRTLSHFYRSDEKKRSVYIANNSEILVRYNQDRFVRPKDDTIGGGLYSQDCLCGASACVGDLSRSFCNGLYKQKPLMSLFYTFLRRNNTEMPNFLGDVDTHFNVVIDMK